MSTYDDERGRLIPFRLDEQARRLSDLERWRSEVDKARAAEEVEQEQLVKQMATLTTAMDDLRGILTKFAYTLAGSAVLVMVSVLIGTGKL